jgi:tRNA (guanine-N7-)-methyltransferase
METFSNVFQCGAREMLEDNPVVAMRGKWHEEYFHNDNPIVLELGCGRGEYTVGLAACNPDKNYIGIDIKGARMWAGAKQAELAGMKNVAFLRTNIEMLAHFFAPNEVAEIWITFPDPQMKKVTKRLTSTYFMERYNQLLAANGLIHLKTDSPFLYTYTDALVKVNNLPTEVNNSDIYGSSEEFRIQNSELNIRTYYEQQWLDRGLSIKYLKFRLIPGKELQEPEIEIELDDYRSYNRSKRSGLQTSR